MPRPCKRRRICAEPRYEGFGPRGFEGADVVVMALDEYEAIRLIDLEGLTQEECARQMEVARTTVQAIYTAAREKLARCLVQGCELRIGGGEYRMCDGQNHHCHRHRHCGGGCCHSDKNGGNEV